MKAGVAMTANWERMFKILRIFFRSHGHCDVPPNPRADSLHQWLAQQRLDNHAGRLSPAQFKRLDVLGVFAEAKTSDRSAWAGTNEERWEKNFAKLLAFREKFGHPHVSSHWSIDRPLGTWVASQRKYHQLGRLAPERFARLDKIGFAWNGKPVFDALWEKRFTKLLAFKKKYGHCDVPCHGKQDPTLGNWISVQREYRKRGILNPERVARLDKIGFQWAIHYNRDEPAPAYRLWNQHRDRSWDARFTELLAYKKKHGHVNVGIRDGMGGSLHDWVTRQRSEARRHTLVPVRRQQLEKIGFVWGGRPVLAALWEKNFTKLVAYKKQHGHCDVPCHWPEDRPFGHWISIQREFRKKGKLRPERIARLDQLGFKWVARINSDSPAVSFGKLGKIYDQLWDSRLANLLAYQKQHGHVNVGNHDGMGGRLHKWVTRQREHARHNTLPPARRRQLEKIGFVWGGRPVLAALWEKNFTKLVAYKKRFSHCNVPCHWKSDMALGHWVSVQREFRKKGMLRPERIARLDEIGFQWVMTTRQKPVAHT